MAPFAVDHEDVEYARPDGMPLLARVYRPRDAGSGPWPALVDVHGGAWSRFDRTVDWYFDSALAAAGMVVVALDFRQAPVRYPTAVADVVAGIKWTKAHAAALGVRPGGVGLIGGSSGGHLAMLAALRPHAPEYTTTPAPPADATVACVLALWPILDPLARYRYLLDRRANPTPPRDPLFHLETLLDGHESFFGDAATMERASALRIVESGEAECLVPVWLAHPEHDENVTRAMSERFVDAYRRAGGDVELALFEGVGHGFGNFPGPDADACIAQMRRFLTRCALLERT